jgi:acyl-CoA synthetase (AMP-forming)/AMP-acid ligase II
MEEKDRFTIRDLIYEGGQDPDQHAIESPGYRPLTYRDLRLQILSTVKSLNARGFHRNDRIAVISPPGPETAVCIVAVMAGFTAVPLNMQYKATEYEDIFHRVGIQAVITEQGTATAATAVAESRAVPVIEMVPSGTAGKFDLLPFAVPVSGDAEFATPTDTAYILLTSGTTGRSKIVPRTQKDSAIGRQRACTIQKITPADRCLHIVPYHHGMGISTSLLIPLAAGATVICTKDFIPSDFIGLLRTFCPTYYSAGPALNQGILRELKKVNPDQLKNHSLRYIGVSSGFLREDLQKGLESVLGVPVIDSYGMSETGLIAINLPPRRGSVGIPRSESLSILDENGMSLGSNCVGEIVIKDCTLFSGYEGGRELKDSAFINGWFRTGDLGYLDDDGYLFLTGRNKELINKAGEKVSPEEIDTVLMSHPGVREAKVFPVPDPVLGEDIGAMVVVADEQVTAADLRKYLLDRLVQFKVPRRIWFVEAVPRNAAGKPLRRAGTERYCQAEPDHHP